MNADIIHAANEAAPEVMEKVAKALYVLERIEPELAADLAAEISDITDYTNEKVAASDLGGVKVWAGAVGGAIAAGLAGAVATDLYDAAKRGLTKGMNFKRILEANPDLKKNYDSKQLKKSFDTFHRYAPDFTSDPNLGGQILKSMAEIPENQHQIVKDLLTSRKNLRDTKRGQFAPSNTPFIPQSAIDNATDKQVERQLWLSGKQDALKRSRDQIDSDWDSAKSIQDRANMMSHKNTPFAPADVVQRMDAGPRRDGKKK